MKSLQELEAYGIDIKGAMERFMNNEEMFRSFLKKLPEENVYPLLMEALKEEDVERAFQLAHQLKGILGNLSLVELYDKIFDMVEDLRKNNLPSAESQKCFSEMYDTMMDYIREEV